MPGASPTELWPYPLPSEVLTRQKLVDLADAMHISLATVNVDRLAELQRPRGLLRASTSNVFTVGTTGYMSFNVDSLDAWQAGGRAITATQGPTLAQGLYYVTFFGLITAFSATTSTYTRLDVEFEIGGVRRLRRTLTLPGQTSLRISAPIRVVGSQQVRVRVLAAGSTASSTVTIGQNLDEASPRLSWSRVAAN